MAAKKDLLAALLAKSGSHHGEVLPVDKLCLQLAERIRDRGTDMDLTPFGSGELRKSLQTPDAVSLLAHGVARVGSYLPYARAVHDGRPALTIKPNLAKNPPYGFRKHQDPKRARLKFKLGNIVVFARQVFQPARKGNPWLLQAAREVLSGDLDWLLQSMADDISTDKLKKLLQQIKLNLTI